MVMFNDFHVFNIFVTYLPLVCSIVPDPIKVDFTDDLERFNKWLFLLKEDVEYQTKVSF